MEPVVPGLLPAVPYISIADVFADPGGTASRLQRSGAPAGLVGITLVGADRAVVVYHVHLAPWPLFASAGYPDEQLGILITRDGGAYAGPLDGNSRRWKHRYPTPLQGPTVADGVRMLGQLCLWYPRDPRQERWEAEDGLVCFLEIAHRHVLAEECWRRSGYSAWPGREAPHGSPPAARAQRAA
ncbi:MAG: hypothetical protein ACYDAC_12680 [Candidatus Dormibacteria bacterium]